jgi:hypothetical protein
MLPAPSPAGPWQPRQPCAAIGDWDAAGWAARVVSATVMARMRPLRQFQRMIAWNRRLLNARSRGIVNFPIPKAYAATWIGGRAENQSGLARSTWAASWISTSSQAKLPWICTPIGRPPLSSPAGSEMPGMPVSLPGMV